MKRIIPLLFITLTACQEMEQIDLSELSPQEREAVSSLSWLKKADAPRDAREAIENGDNRLYAMAGRAPSIPGVPEESREKAESLCGLRYVEGSTDAIVGDVHLKLLQAAREYASEYNRLMLDACLKQAP